MDELELQMCKPHPGIEPYVVEPRPIPEPIITPEQSLG